MCIRDRYREKILSALKRDLTSSFAPLEASVVLTVGATAKDYRGDSWSGVNNQSEFYARSQNKMCIRDRVDTGDVHCLMIGAAGVGKTAHFLYPNIEYACACGMSFLTTDTKGDLYLSLIHI